MRRFGLMMVLMMLLIPALVFGYERYVRTDGSQPVVRDNMTGLIWQGCHAGLIGASCENATGGARGMTWEEALAYCDSLKWAGISDWRLPDPKELRSIVDNQRICPAVDGDMFPKTGTHNYWTSSPVASDESFAWSVDFEGGPVDKRYDKGLSLGVRCVYRGP